MELIREFNAILLQGENEKNYIIPSEGYSYETTGEFNDPVEFAGLDPESNTTVCEYWEDWAQWGGNYHTHASIEISLPEDFITQSATPTSAKLYFRMRLAYDRSGAFGALPLSIWADDVRLGFGDLGWGQLKGDYNSIDLTNSLCTAENLNSSTLGVYIGQARPSPQGAGEISISVYGFKLVLKYD